ncbi:MAG: hypothetical protein A3G22_06480 [Alphaproteobacteria bacterium RIFCSPLOWO2_12_FULL_40_11]|nr:MAG: hypothetical protein A2794_04200 [Alphaproteobacteria bacterium RIFCSPHIGHO2_01_FULL_40_8]OFX10241.1 MAG: hypothetical protein A3H30_05320 [Alphaproteobacteria bacterium RIFCSPLOWO2_02_FULL_40_19]OFX11825.1 MAG: hypothetical protein A3G22_06480 [Alphaproteobacteria bacterium RIFCSPLOWO2_12_FULL_40_11]
MRGVFYSAFLDAEQFVLPSFIEDEQFIFPSFAVEQECFEEQLDFSDLVLSPLNIQLCLSDIIPQADKPPVRTTPAIANLADFKNLDFFDISLIDLRIVLKILCPE